MPKIGNTVKRFFKELKRVRWPSGLRTWKTFYIVLLFIGITAIMLFFVALGFTSLWAKIGVGANGN